MTSPLLPAAFAGIAAGLLSADVSRFIKGWALAPALVEDKEPVVWEALKGRVETIRAARRKHDPTLWEETCYSVAFHMRAGETAAQAVRAVSLEGDKFTNRILADVAHSYDAGASLEAALAAETQSYPELGQIASALEMGTAGGGDIPALLCHLADSMRRRRLSRGEVRSKLTESRSTAVLLSLLPWGVGAYTLGQSEVSAQAMLRDPRGKALLLLALALWAVGNVAVFLMLRKLAPPASPRRTPTAGRGGRAE